MQLFAHAAAASLKPLMSRPGIHPDAARCDFCGKTRRLKHNDDLKLNLCSRSCREGAEAAKLEIALAESNAKIDALLNPYRDSDLDDCPEDVWFQVDILSEGQNDIYLALHRLRRQNTRS